MSANGGSGNKKHPHHRIRVASRIPGARIGCVEVRPTAEDSRTLCALGILAPD